MLTKVFEKRLWRASKIVFFSYSSFSSSSVVNKGATTEEDKQERKKKDRRSGIARKSVFQRTLTTRT